jgi:response regulator RpfG family c-di-GMP phosphodiesterase
MNDPSSILCVDDEEQVLNSLERTLRLKNYAVFTASGGARGLEILGQEHVDVVIADQRMPGMTGSEFLRIVKEKYPNTVRIMLSGYSDFESLTKAINEGEIFRFVSKPWEMEELFEIIELALKQNKIIKVVSNLVKNVCDMTKLANNIRVESCEDTGCITVQLEKKGDVFTNATVFEFLNLLFDSLDLGENERPKTLSGLLKKDDETIMISIAIGRGVTMRIKLPNIKGEGKEQA